MPNYLIYLNGVLLGLSLIMSLGPQNIFLIRQAAIKKHTILSVSTCFLCDVILITASIKGLNQVLLSHPDVRIGMCWLGSAFLVYYGTMTLMSAIKQKKDTDSSKHLLTNRWQIILLALGFSLLNPQAIIDSLILIGGGSTQFPEHQEAFLLGVITSSLIWFTLLTSITHYFSEVISRRNVWRCIECASAFLMLAIAIKLIYIR